MVMAALPRLAVASGQCVVIDPRGSAIACGFSFARMLLSFAAAARLSAAAQAQKAPESAAPPAKAAPAKTPQTKVKSACNQISDEAKCKADVTCSWIAALTDGKTGKQKRKAYCKSKPKPSACQSRPRPKNTTGI
jgi:hypothetical protein